MSREPEVSAEDFARIVEAFHGRFPTPYCLYRDDYDSWREEKGKIPQGLHLFVGLVEAIKTCGERAAARAVPPASFAQNLEDNVLRLVGQRAMDVTHCDDCDCGWGLLGEIVKELPSPYREAVDALFGTLRARVEAATATATAEEAEECGCRCGCSELLRFSETRH
jgi:hypothetical protein